MLYREMRHHESNFVAYKILFIVRKMTAQRLCNFAVN